jgi:hypothetical protein
MTGSESGYEMDEDQKRWFEATARFERAIRPLEEEIVVLPSGRRQAAENHVRAVRYFAVIGMEPPGEVLSKCFVLALATTAIAFVPGAIMIGLFAYAKGISAVEGWRIIAFVTATWAIAVSIGFWVGRNSPPGTD